MKAGRVAVAFAAKPLRLLDHRPRRSGLGPVNCGGSPGHPCPARRKIPGEPPPALVDSGGGAKSAAATQFRAFRPCRSRGHPAWVIGAVYTAGSAGPTGGERMAGLGGNIWAILDCSVPWISSICDISSTMSRLRDIGLHDVSGSITSRTRTK